jgi:hypothetical protein
MGSAPSGRTPEWKIEQREYKECDAFGSQDVPGPWSKKTEKRRVLRFGAEVHIVRLVDEIERAGPSPSR